MGLFIITDFVVGLRYLFPLDDFKEETNIAGGYIIVKYRLCLL